MPKFLEVKWAGTEARTTYAVPDDFSIGDWLDAYFDQADRMVEIASALRRLPTADESEVWLKPHEIAAYELRP